MIFCPASKEKLKDWRRTHSQFKDKLKPNRKRGSEVLEYLKNKYILDELTEEKYLKAVSDNVLNNEFLNKNYRNIKRRVLWHLSYETKRRVSKFMKIKKIFGDVAQFISVLIYNQGKFILRAAASYMMRYMPFKVLINMIWKTVLG